MSWMNTVKCLTDCLGNLLVSDGEGETMDVEAGFKSLCYISQDLKDRTGTIFLVGNGASASMASHVAANDISYDAVFAEPLRRRMQQGDMLVAISSSGNSPNVANAAAEARKIGGHVVTLSAMQPGNRLQGMGDLNFYLPGHTYGLAESGHAAVLHHWIDMMVARCSD